MASDSGLAGVDNVPGSAGNDGFVAPVVELGAAADSLAGAAERVTSSETRRGEVIPAPGLEVLPRLEQAEADWVSLVNRAATAASWGAAELRATATSYREIDAALARQIREILPTRDRASEHARDAGARLAHHCGSAEARAEPGEWRAGAGQDLREMWRERGRAAEAAVADLWTVVAVAPGWCGTAADDYRTWLSGHRTAWSRLADAADRVHRALSGQAPPPDPAVGPAVTVRVPGLRQPDTTQPGPPQPSTTPSTTGADGNAGVDAGVVDVEIDVDGDGDLDARLTVALQDPTSPVDPGIPEGGASVDGGVAPVTLEPIPGEDRGVESPPPAPRVEWSADSSADRPDSGHDVRGQPESSPAQKSEQPALETPIEPGAKVRDETQPSERAPQPPTADPPAGELGPNDVAVGEGQSKAPQTSQEVPAEAIWIGAGVTAAAAGAAAMFLARRDRASTAYTSITEAGATVPPVPGPITGPGMSSSGRWPPRGPVAEVRGPGRWEGVAGSPGEPGTSERGIESSRGPAKPADGRHPMPRAAWPSGSSAPPAPTDSTSPPLFRTSSLLPCPPGGVASESGRWAWRLQAGSFAGRPLVVDLAVAAVLDANTDPNTAPRTLASGGVVGMSGVGVSGPGGLEVVRGLLLAALAQAPDAQVVLSAGVAQQLLLDGQTPEPAATSGPPGTGPGLGPGGLGRGEAVSLEELAGVASVDVVPDPHAVVELVEIELAARRRAHTTPSVASAALPRPWLVILPAPTTTPTRHRLRALIAAATAHRIGFVLCGAWPDAPCWVLDSTHRLLAASAAATDGAGAGRGSGAGGAAVAAAVLPPGAQLVAASVEQLRGYVDQLLAEAADPAQPGVPPTAGDAAGPIADASGTYASAAGSSHEIDGAGAISAALAPDAIGVFNASGARTGVELQPAGPPRTPFLPDSAARAPHAPTSGAEASGAGPGSSDAEASGAEASGGGVAGSGGSAREPGLGGLQRGPSTDHPHDASGANTDPNRRQEGAARGDAPASDGAVRGEPGASGEVAGRAGAPRLVLSILGPTVLRYLDPADRSGPSEGPVPVAAGAVTDAGAGRVVEGLGPRALELIVFLAVHPQGVARDSVVAALWPEADRRRPTNALNSTLARLRSVLRQVDPEAAWLVKNRDGRYRLDPDLVTVDYWDLLVAAAHLGDPEPGRRVWACEVVIDAYRGALGVELTGEWLITLREATRRRFLDALTSLARLLVDTDPERTLGLLETARNIDPLVEALYRDIMWIQHRLGRPEAAAGTLALLETVLADIGATPEPATLELAAAIAARAALPELDHPPLNRPSHEHPSRDHPIPVQRAAPPPQRRHETAHPTGAA